MPEQKLWELHKLLVDLKLMNPQEGPFCMIEFRRNLRGVIEAVEWYAHHAPRQEVKR